MAIAHGSMGAVGSGQASIVSAYPASIAAGDLLLLALCSKYPPNGPSTPSGWSLAGQYSGGHGSAGTDAGNVYVTVYYRLADGTETGNVTVTITGGNSARGRIARYTKASDKVWDLGVAGGVSSTPGNWSMTADVDPGITANDFVVVFSAANGDVATMLASTAVFAATGLTIGTVTYRNNDGTTQGDDSSLFWTDHPVSSGTASAPGTYVFTRAGSTTADSPAGATLILRLREAPATNSGAAAITFADDTCSGAGAVAVAGAAAITFADDTLSAAGTVATSGALAVTFTDDTCVGAGTVAIAGTASLAFADDTCAGVGVVAIAGVLSTTSDDDTLEATGAVRVAGALAVTFEDDTAVGEIVARSPPPMFEEFTASLEFDIMPFVFKVGNLGPGIAGSITAPPGVDLTDVALTLKYRGRKTGTRIVRDAVNDGLALDSPAVISGEPTIWRWHYLWQEGDTDVPDTYEVGIDAEVDGMPMTFPNDGWTKFYIQAQL